MRFSLNRLQRLEREDAPLLRFRTFFLMRDAIPRDERFFVTA